MPPTVAGLTQKQRTVTVEIDGETLTCQVRPFSIEERHAMVGQIEDKPTHADIRLAEFLSSILIGWDLTTAPDDPTPYPTDPASLQKLPPEVVAAILQAVGEAQTLGKASTGSS
jgi:hypothetical protein